MNIIAAEKHQAQSDRILRPMSKRVIYTSGQIPVDPATGNIAEGNCSTG